MARIGRIDYETSGRRGVGLALRVSAAGAGVGRVESSAAPHDATTRMLVSITFGAATSRPGELPDTLLEHADQALLDAKHAPHASRRPNR